MPSGPSSQRRWGETFSPDSPIVTHRHVGVGSASTVSEVVCNHGQGRHGGRNSSGDGGRRAVSAIGASLFAGLPSHVLAATYLRLLPLRRTTTTRRGAPSSSSGSVAHQRLVAQPVGLVGIDPQAFPTISLIVGEIALPPTDLGVALEGQYVGGDPVEEPAVVADDDDATAKSSRASSSARRVSTSRSFVGSSRRSTLPPLLRTLASCTRLRSPPESWPTFFCWSLPLNPKLATYARAWSSRFPTTIRSTPPVISSKTVASPPGCHGTGRRRPAPRRRRSRASRHRACPRRRSS